MNEYVIYVQDTETTGFEPGIHEVIELSLLRLSRIEGGWAEEQKTWLLKALKPDTIQDDALSKNGHKKEDILCQTQYGKENYKLPSDVILDIEDWVAQDKMSAHDRVFAGQNPLFDFNHMVALWDSCDAADTFPWVTGHNKLLVDAKQIALFFDICMGRKRERYNLSSLVKSYGVKKGKAHRADEDTRMTKDLLVKYIDAVLPCVKEKFKDCI